MADNTTFQSTTLATPPSGLVVATDQIGGVDHQRVKVEWGADGTATDVSASDPLPVVQTGSLPAGTNAIGKLAANSGVDIGDVDVTSVAGTGTNAASQVTVTNSSTTIIASRSGRRGVLVTNNQTVAVYIDPSGGTAATTHFRLDPGASVVLPVTSAVTGITSAAYSASGDAKMHVIELF